MDYVPHEYINLRIMRLQVLIDLHVHPASVSRRDYWFTYKSHAQIQVRMGRLLLIYHRK